MRTGGFSSLSKNRSCCLFAHWAQVRATLCFREERRVGCLSESEFCFHTAGSHFVLDSGGPYGSLGVDYEFEKLLCKIFGEDFIEQFKIKRPAAWVDLMIAFESRKRAAAPDRTNPLNITLPFSFIDYYKKFRGHSVEHALRKSK